MKKIAICLLATCLSLTFIPLQSSGATVTPERSVPSPKPVESAEAKALELRLNEISKMDKTNMKSAEKKSLRKEVRATNHKLREIGGGVYLSAGALILILLVLIVLL